MWFEYPLYAGFNLNLLTLKSRHFQASWNHPLCFRACRPTGRYPKTHVSPRAGSGFWNLDPISSNSEPSSSVAARRAHSINHASKCPEPSSKATRSRACRVPSHRNLGKVATALTPSGLGCPLSHRHGMAPLAEAQHVLGQGSTEGPVCSHLPTGLSLFPEGKPEPSPSLHPLPALSQVPGTTK